MEEKSDIEIPDPWSGPRHYAQDFYSGGPSVLPPGATANADHLGPQDSQHIDMVDVQEGVLEEEIDEEIEDEIQPLNADDCKVFFSLENMVEIELYMYSFPSPSSA
jgi:hypothetical protein